jgi:hypothetical protein
LFLSRKEDGIGKDEKTTTSECLAICFRGCFPEKRS